MRSAQHLLLIIVVLLIAQVSWAVKFDLPATSGGSKNERCIRNFVGSGQLVVVTAIVSGDKGDGQVVNMIVCFGIRYPALSVRPCWGILRKFADVSWMIRSRIR